MRYIWLTLLFLGTFQTIAQTNGQENSLDFLIRNHLEPIGPGERRKIEGTYLYSTVVISRFYENRAFHPAWIENEKPKERAYEMRYEIRQAQFDGLQPEDYHLVALDQLFSKIESDRKSGKDPSLNDLATLDLLLTDAYILLSSHLYLGKVNPDNLTVAWNIQRYAPDLRIDQRLEKALQEENIRKSLEALYPSFSIYKKMRDGLRQLYGYLDKYKNNNATEWKALKLERSIKPDDSHPLIPEIRKRLTFWGMTTEYTPEDIQRYDSLLRDGVKKFQRMHGLEPDGVIGQGTIQAFNQTPNNLIIAARVNLERLRWLPDSLKLKEEELIVVNTANFQLDYIHKRDTLLSSRVIVGKTMHSTPQFDAEMSYIVFSPTWTVPSSITRKEIIPLVKRNPYYLAKNHMKILANNGAEIPASSIDWSKVSARTFPYTIRQEPGEDNALGLVKFMFPNKHSVYIHDTPARSLFEREDRALSHGCIRIQKPFELAKLLLSFDPSWTDEKIREHMSLPKEKTVMLDRKIPVVVLYLTYWADSKGDYYFRKDLYSRDAEIYNLLRSGKVGKSGI